MPNNFNLLIQLKSNTVYRLTVQNFTVFTVTVTSESNLDFHWRFH